MAKRENRSAKYQFMFCENLCSHEMLNDFANSEGLMANNSSYNDELYLLKDKLKVELWKLIDTELTPRQREVIRLYAKGYTQTEIARLLGINQSSITKSIHGNVDYRSGKRVYGGAKKKLRKLAEKDEAIQSIIKRISEIESEFEP